MKKVGKTTRPFRHDLNQIPYDYTVEVSKRFKGLDLIDRVPDGLWNEVRDTVQETGIKTILMEKKCKKQNGCLGVSLYIFYILSYLLLKTMGCFSGCLMSPASVQSCFVGFAQCSNEYIFPFLLCFSLLFFSQLFVSPPQTAILLFEFLFLGDGLDPCLLYNVMNLHP